MSRADEIIAQQVLLRLYEARLAAIEAKKALAKHFRDAYPADPVTGEPHPNDHRFGACEQSANVYGSASLCDVCEASKPLHDAYISAACRAGSALRQAREMGKRLSEAKR